jgi:hypothetical protein
VADKNAMHRAKAQADEAKAKAPKYNAMADAKKVAWRASMLPLVNYDDGTGGFGWPQTLIDAKNAFARFHRGEAPQPEDAVLAGLAMTGAGAFGLGSRAARGSVAGAERAEASSGLPSNSVEAGRLASNPPEAAPAGFIPAAAGAGPQPLTARVYRGASNHEQWPPTNPRHDAFWASDNPEVASSYASEAIRHGGDMGSVTPADVTFQNPMVVNAKGNRWDQWHADGEFSSNELLRQARNAGHDGLVIQQTQDGLTGGVPVATTYAALKPGTVKSATTGETLFSNPPDAAPAGLLATPYQEGQPMPDFNTAFRELQMALQDLDGDGVPDPIATAPQQPVNAMAGMRGGPMTGPERAEEAGMAHIRANAGVPMGPNAPGQNAFAKFAEDAWRDVKSDPVGAIFGGAQAFAGSAGPMSASRTAANPASRHMAEREIRSYTEAGSKRNTLDDLQVGVRRDMEAKNTFAAQREVQLSNTPHWQLQPNVKGPDGKYRFQKLPDDVKVAREKGIELRRREAEAIERAKKYNEGAN